MAKLDSVVNFHLSLAETHFEAHRSQATQYGISPVTAVQGKFLPTAERLAQVGVWGVQRLSEAPEITTFAAAVGVPTIVHKILLQATEVWLDAGAEPVAVVGTFPRINTRKTATTQVSSFVDILNHGGHRWISDEAVIVERFHRDWPDWETAVAGALRISEINRVLGRATGTGVGLLLPLVSATSFLAPQLIKKGPRVTVVCCGIMEAPLVELAVIASRRLGLAPPAATYLRTLPGLNGSPRMTSVRPSSTLLLGEDETSVRKKINKMKTGGQPTRESQRLLGGRANECDFISLAQLLAPAEISQLARDRCVKGRLCGDCKSDFLSSITSAVDSRGARSCQET